MNNFEFLSPTRIIFGKGTEADVGKHVKKYGKNVLIVYGSERLKDNGLIGAVEKSLDQYGIAHTGLCGIQPNPRLDKVYEGVKACKEKGIDFILAIGGGSVIDTAKAIAIGAVSDIDIWDFYMNKAEAEEALPIGAILTIAAAGSEASWATVIFNEADGLKRAYHSDLIRPVFAILNPELTMSLPADQTAYGCVDIFMHCVERYFTNVKNVEYTDRLNEATFKTILTNSKKAVDDPEDYDARAEILWASTLANNDIFTTGRVPDWASHVIGHELSAKYEIPHGLTVAIIGLAWMKYVYKHDLPRFEQFAVRVMGVEPDFFDPEPTILCGIERLRQFYESLGLPVTLGELGVIEDSFEGMAENSTLFGNIGNFVALGKNDVIEIYKLAM